MKKTLIAFGLLALSLNVHAAIDNVIFTDNFESNSLGLNAVPNGWAVTNGTVDIIGSAPGKAVFDLLPNTGHGKYVDLDGSTFSPGILSIQTSLLLNAGTPYTVSYDLAGNQRNDRYDTVTVALEGANDDSLSSAGESVHLDKLAPWQRRSFTFTPTTTANYVLSFQNSGKDNIGLLLDNVSVTSPAPEPETYAMMLAGLSLLGVRARRRKSAQA